MVQDVPINPHNVGKFFYFRKPSKSLKKATMVKNIFFTATIVFLLGVLNPTLAQKSKQGTPDKSKTDLKFLDDIIVDVPVSTGSTSVSNQPAKIADADVLSKKAVIVSGAVENASSLQFKYSLLLDIEVEQIKNMNLFKVIDDWMGTRYKLGGTTKSGIDCSAFMQVVFTALYGITLPRTAKDQYNICRKISRTELKEGDLVFFNTTGGVSHVGMYLQNNKFVHASSSGVTISDLYDDYWVRRFIGVGRIDSSQLNAYAALP